MKKFKRRYLLILPAAVFVFIAWHWLTEPNPAKGPLAPLKRTAGDVHYTKLVIAGDPVEAGNYDPSLAYAPDGSVGWLAYSSVRGNFKPVGPYVHTHLARTTDAGASWTFVKVLNLSTNGTCVMPDGQTLQGVWRYEVSSLVRDPADPDANRRWKLFVHKYFWAPKRDRMVTYGWIVLRTAADPAGEWSEEVPLFGAGKNPLAPYNKTRVDVNSLDASLKNTITYTEPGALVHDGRLYVSMTALHPHIGLDGISVGYTIILLASENHGVSWKFAGTLLTAKDANDFGYEYFDGTALATEGGHVFLLAVPGSRRLMHDGCVAFEFESLAKGQLRRDAIGDPVVMNYFAPQPGILSGPGAGQSTYHSANVNGGLIFPQFNLGAYPEVFQIYQTGRKIVTRD
jgi:hypothetical protein